MIQCPFSGRTIREPEKSPLDLESRFLTDFEREEYVAAGGYGCVVHCFNKLDSCHYAVKKINLKFDWDYESAQREVVAFSSCSNHPNVVRYYQAWFEPCITGISHGDDHESNEDPEDSDDGSGSSTGVTSPCLYIQQEFCPRTLETFLESADCLPKDSAWRIFRQITEGLAHIHGKNFVHRDLTSKNVFLDEHLNIKIGDFGLSMMTTDDMSDGMRAAGEQLYKAPESYKEGARVDAKADIFSLGVILFELFYNMPTEKERTGTLLQLKKNDSRNEVFDKICADQNLQQSGEGFQLVREFLSTLLSDDPAERPSALDILIQNPWED